MKINNKYTHGDLVYLVTDPEQQARMISALSILPGGLIIYTVAFNGEETDHWEFELSSELDQVKKVVN